MDESAKNSPCKECNEEEGLHAEVEHLRQHLAERDTHIVALEGEFIKCGARASELEEELNTWQEKYERLYDSHKRVQKLNQVLEDKLLQMVDKMKGEKSQLTKDIATLSVRLAESKHNYSMLQKENERYKNDMNLAIQLLQCKPDNFVAQKLDNLPIDTQTRVSQYVMSKTSKPSSSIQSKNGNSITEIDTFDASEYEFNISASLMSKILEDSIQDTVTKHCDTCTCNKSQNKPFCYNETFYSVSTQTHVSGEINGSHCLSCKSEVKSAHSNISITSISPHTIKLINEKSVMHAPLYLVPQPSVEPPTDAGPLVINTMSSCDVNESVIDEKITLEADVQIESVPKIPEDLKQLRINSSVSMEPSVHHKLCDRTKTSMSSKKSSIHSVGNEELLITKDIPDSKEIKPKSDKLVDNINLRKSSQSSMGAVSRASSVAKSTVSTHKSNTQVGPGPRFCHLRMQAGSKNILLDNAEPDVPPVLYRRLSKCNDNSLFKDLNDDLDNFIHVDRDKVDDEIKEDVINDNVVVESTLIDVHVDNNVKEPSTASKNGSINPVLLNVSSSPLQPLKTHNFSNSSERNNNNSQSIGSQQNTSEIDNLLNDFTQDVTNPIQNNNDQPNDAAKKPDILTPTDNHDVKIFNFDRYEQNMLGNQYSKPLRKIDMAQLHSLENTKISKDLPPKGDLPKLEKKPDIAKPSLPPIVNVYPNLTQTHLKVNENNKVFTNEHSTSSLSSDDSAAMLQKQQLLRVAEWVEKNLEQQNNFNDPLEDDVNFSNKATRRSINLTRLTESLNELALNMPHPVSKYSNFSRDPNAWSHNASQSARPSHEKGKTNSTRMPGNIMKETIFPVECGDATITEVSSDNPRGIGSLGFDVGKELREAIKSKGHKDISPEDLARMEYNVKKFLLSGPHWASQGPSNRSRCTSSKTETDV